MGEKRRDRLENPEKSAGVAFIDFRQRCVRTHAAEVLPTVHKFGSERGTAGSGVEGCMVGQLRREVEEASGQKRSNWDKG